MKGYGININLERWRPVIAKILAMLAFIVALMEVVRLSGFLGITFGSILTPVIFSVTCFIPLFVFVQSRNFTVNNILLLLFCVVGAISLVFNHPMQHSISALKFSIFVGMLCLLTPLVDNDTLRYFRSCLWRYTVILCQIVVMLSLLTYIVSTLTSSREFLPVFVPRRIMLSTIAAFVTVVLTSRLFTHDYRSKWLIAIDVISLVGGIVMMIWSGSRGAVLGCMAAEIYMLYAFRRRLKEKRWVIAGIMTPVLLTVILCSDVTYLVVRKFEIGHARNSIIFSRKQMWKSRIAEFTESPVIGIGFACATHYPSLYDEEVFEVTHYDRGFEPGSSWLCVLSNTGIIGFILIAGWNIQLLRAVRRRRRNGDSIAVGLGGLLIFFLVEGCFEGWILFAGSFVFFLYWLLSSRILDGKAALQLVGEHEAQGECR